MPWSGLAIPIFVYSHPKSIQNTAVIKNEKSRMLIIWYDKLEISDQLMKIKVFKT